MAELDFHERSTPYLNLNALNIPLNDQQQFKVNKIHEIKDFLLLRLKKRINEQKAQ